MRIFSRKQYVLTAPPPRSFLRARSRVGRLISTTATLHRAVDVDDGYGEIDDVRKPKRSDDRITTPRSRFDAAGRRQDNRHYAGDFDERRGSGATRRSEYGNREEFRDEADYRRSGETHDGVDASDYSRKRRQYRDRDVDYRDNPEFGSNGRDGGSGSRSAFRRRGEGFRSGESSTRENNQYSNRYDANEGRGYASKDSFKQSRSYENRNPNLSKYNSYTKKKPFNDYKYNYGLAGKAKSHSNHRNIQNFDIEGEILFGIHPVSLAIQIGRRIVHKLYVNRGRFSEALEVIEALEVSTAAKVRSVEISQGSDEINHDSSDIKNDSSDIKNDSSDIKNDSSDIKNDSSDIKNDSSISKNDSSEIKQEAQDSSPKLNTFQRIVRLAHEKHIEIVGCTRGELDLMSMNRPNQDLSLSRDPYSTCRSSSKVPIAMRITPTENPTTLTMHAFPTTPMLVPPTRYCPTSPATALQAPLLSYEPRSSSPTLRRNLSHIPPLQYNTMNSVQLSLSSRGVLMRNRSFIERHLKVADRLWYLMYEYTLFDANALYYVLFQKERKQQISVALPILQRCIDKPLLPLCGSASTNQIALEVVDRLCFVFMSCGQKVVVDRIRVCLNIEKFEECKEEEICAELVEKIMAVCIDSEVNEETRELASSSLRAEIMKRNNSLQISLCKAKTQSMSMHTLLKFILTINETNKSSKQFQRILELQEKTLSETKDLRGELINFLDQWKINYDKETVGNEVKMPIEVITVPTGHKSEQVTECKRRPLSLVNIKGYDLLQTPLTKEEPMKMKAFSDIRTALGINRLPHQQISTNRTSLPVYSRGVTRGVCLDVDALEYESSYDLESMLQRPCNEDKHGLWLLLESIQDPMNFGAILRTAYYLGVDAVFTPKSNTCKLSPVVSKASSGMLEILPVNQIDDISTFLQSCRSNGWQVVGTSVATAKDVMSISNLSINTNTLLILGNEGFGISEKMSPFVDKLITIESGQKEMYLDSLNVSVSTGILIHEISKKLIK